MMGNSGSISLARWVKVNRPSPGIGSDALHNGVLLAAIFHFSPRPMIQRAGQQIVRAIIAEGWWNKSAGLGIAWRPRTGRTKIRLVSPSRLSRRWPGSANETQPLDPTAVIAPILNHVPALAVGVDLLNSHGLCAVDARYERGQRALVIIHWRATCDMTKNYLRQRLDASS